MKIQVEHGQNDEHRRLQDASGKQAVPYCTVAKRSHSFQGGRKSGKNKPATSQRPTAANKVHAVCMTIRTCAKLSSETGIVLSTNHKRAHNDTTQYDRGTPVAMCRPHQTAFESYREGEAFLHHTLTADETRIHSYESELNRQ